MPTTVRKEWIRIEIGYESDVPEKGTEQPEMQKLLVPLFKSAALMRWALGGSTEFTTSATNDEWVKDLLKQELYDGLEPNYDPVYIVEKHTLFDLTSTDSGPGTRCKLHADRWINSRTYALRQEDDENADFWPPDRDPRDARTFITLTWICWSPDSD